MASKDEEFVAEVRRWLRAWRYGPPWLLPAMAGVALLGLGSASEHLPIPAKPFTKPALLVAGILCLTWSAWKISRRPIAPAPPEDTEKPPALKGASSFGPQDARLFSRLGRRDELKALNAQVHNDQVPLIVVYGESGLGKTSLLRAGLEGGADPARLRVIYWEASPADPEASLLHAARVQWGEPQPVPSSLRDLIEPTPGEPRVVIIDQAEQLSPERHAAVFGLLAAAASSLPPYRTTWIVAFRRSYMATWRDFELSLEKAVRSRLEYLSLKPFTVKTAAEVVSVLVEESGLPIESAVVDAIIRAVAEDGTVSPVDIGISLLAVSELAAGQTSFSVRQYLEAGGLTTLLRNYLVGLLERFSPREREELGRALLRLVDLATDKRIAEGLSAEELLAAAQSESPRDFAAALDFLASPKARILEVLPSADPPRYRLVHERLIPAVRRLAGPILLGQEQARVAFDRAFTSWSLERSGRYLLSGRALAQVRANAAAMDLGAAGSDKRRFVKLSRRRRRLRMAGLAAGVLVALLAAIVTPLFLRSQRSSAAREAAFDAWGLPRDLYERVRQLEELGLSGGKVNSLTWLGNATSLTTLDLTASGVTDLEGLPGTVTTLKLSRDDLPAKLPPSVRDLALSGLGSDVALSRLPASVTSLSLAVFGSRVPNLKDLPPTIREIRLSLEPRQLPTDWSNLGARVTSLKLNIFRLGGTPSLASLMALPPSLKQIDLSVSTDAFSIGEIDELPPLPPTVTTLEWDSRVRALDHLPPSVSSLALGFAPDLALIPKSVKHLALLGGLSVLDLRGLRELPRSITSLYLDLRSLHLLPPGLSALPPSVRRLALTLYRSQVASLKQLPASVGSLALNFEGGSEPLPDLPRSLTALSISKTSITKLGGLPSSLMHLAVRQDQLRTLDGLPGSVRTLRFEVPSYSPFREAPERRAPP